MEKSITAKFSAFVFLLVVSILLFFLNKGGYLNLPKSFIFQVTGPVQENFQYASNGISEFFYALEKIDKLKKENIELKKENLKLTGETAKLREVQKENESLKKQLGFSEAICKKEICIKWIMGKIIGRDPDNYGRYITVNLGEKNGVKEGQAATLSGGILIGKVAEVFNAYSKIMLVTSPQSSVNSLAQTTRANGVVIGKYSTGLKLEMIDQSEELINGDLVITSGLEEKIPEGLLIGKILNIEESANKVFKEADISLFFNPNHIEEIFIAANDI